ncbi:DUF7619 domain-containing protein [Flavobacterium columnare]|uniref:DUF7619 domain-containing protein n=1 Tax=Flavobacterium columnare TaxID=996 RepID=UPI0009809EBD|nr:T9SS type A sorting domain-containing protein [Flavobacterium columnare]OOB82647.1 hypothetical protein BZL53_09875 [Flavobacterium columnare]PTD16128.1 T9SS C-terminal target domain-containing protein [Flavobacterium columnare]
MKKFYFLFIAFCFFTGVNAQIINIPDANFKQKLLAASSSNKTAKDLNGNYFKIDANSNNEIEITEALATSYLDLNFSSISNLVGIQSFTNLKTLRCSQNQISSLNISSNALLITLDLSYNKLTNLNVSNNTLLTVFDCSFNQLTSLNVDSNIALIELNCFNNQLTVLNVNKNINLKSLICGSNRLAGLNVGNNVDLIKLDCSSNQLTVLDVNNNINLIGLYCDNNQIITSLNVSNNTNLKELQCARNQLSSLDVCSNTALTKLWCNNNQLTSLNVSCNNLLGVLYCNNNQLTSLDLIGNTELFYLNCNYNQLSSLNLINNKNNFQIDCNHNQLSNLILNTTGNNLSLDCSYNVLTSLNLNNVKDLQMLFCSNNQLNSLDLSNQTGWPSVNCDNNQLLSLFLKNGNSEIIRFNNNPNLSYICADESDLFNIQSLINNLGYTNCHVNTYCSFTLGGMFYTIQGNNKFDQNNNGCDVLDLPLSNLKFNITSGSIDGNLISNTSGNYSIPVQVGTHILTPVLENLTYFKVLPTNVVVDFPAQASPFTQNFCVTPNGIHSDVEVSVIPVVAARPGFDAKYKIIYKNKGNVVENGSVNLTFDDAKMDYVSSSPVFNSQSANQLIWSYTNLKPFETRTIDVVFNMNSPMETPAVNGGDVLIYTATITSANTDELPSDNTFTLNQTVVNSFDPNDITCLEGAKVSTSKIGDYVHYMIRFENTGSANATNIVVKDVVDNAKYDVNSIIPIKGSHDFTTRVNGDKVEFIFENINLPFDDATNDGYVSFKIKTKASLVAGDTFSKNANIYFDYNFPITTNTATTTIAALANQDFEFETYFNLYPNPASSNVTLETKSDIELYSVQVYNTLGQLVLVVPNAKNVKNVDVSGLTSGNYFIKINSDKGTSHTKFVKQ